MYWRAFLGEYKHISVWSDVYEPTRRASDILLERAKDT